MARAHRIDLIGPPSFTHCKTKSPVPEPGRGFSQTFFSAGSVHLAAQEGRDFELLILLLIAEEVLCAILDSSALRFRLRARHRLCGCARLDHRTLLKRRDRLC